MFTGIIEKKGIVISNLNCNGANRLIISATFEELQLGESIAVNGVCLTLLPSKKGELHFDVSPETLNISNLANLLAGSEANLERAMMASNRFGGHYVSGHVDAMARVYSVKPMNEFVEIELSGFNNDALLYLIPKGSITVDGVSLTINAVEQQKIKLMLVPHTLMNTTLSSFKIDQKVNIEFDYFARIIAHQLTLSGNLN